LVSAAVQPLFPVTSTVLSSLPRDRHSLNDTNELVAKLYWSEQSRQSEPDILKEVYTIADGKRSGNTLTAMSQRWSGSINLKIRPRRTSEGY